MLETVSPAERVAFVLHDMSGVPFEEIAPVVYRFTTSGEAITAIELIADPARVRELDLTL